MSTREYEDSLTFGKIRVTILKADIANLSQEVDVIVTTVTDRLDHGKAAASKAIADKAGRGVKREIEKQKHRLPLHEGDLIATSGGNLMCRQLYHVTLVPRRDGHSEVITTLITRCLTEADLLARTSIAFPALGTGNLGYPKHDVANAMFDAVHEYSTTNGSSSIRFVHFVVFPSNVDVMREFRSVCKDRTAALTKDEGATTEVAAGNYETLIRPNMQERTPIDDTAPPQVGGRSSRPQNVLPRSLCDEEWFFGNMSRKEAEQKLLEHPVGVYLVRESETASGCYAISLREHDKSKNIPQCVKHYKIQRNDNAMFYITRDRPFKSLQELINDCKESGVHRSTLVNPCPRAPAQEVYDYWDIYDVGDAVSRHTQLEVCSRAHTTNTQPSPCFSSAASMREAKRALPPESMTPEFCSYMYTSSIRPPQYWTKFTSEKSVKEWKLIDKRTHFCELVEVDQLTFQYIENLIQKTWEPDLHGIGRDAEGLSDLRYDGIEITRIQRLENLTLYEEYATKRQTMFLASGKAGVYTALCDVPDMQGGSTHIKELLNHEWGKRLYLEVNEEYLLHGTKPEKVESVYTQGLDPRLSKRAALGAAVYMAESSTKADQYTDSKDNRKTTGLTMFLVRACLGNICRVTKCRPMRRPPCTDSSCTSDECQHVDRYDSVVEEEQYVFREYVVYDKTQVYPEYLISYDRV